MLFIASDIESIVGFAKIGKVLPQKVSEVLVLKTVTQVWFVENYAFKSEIALRSVILLVLLVVLNVLMENLIFLRVNEG